RIPANQSLDCVDPLIEAKAKNLVWLRSPLDVEAANRPVKAAALTSLGFGHVGALLVYAHPAAFEAAVAQQVSAEAASECREEANARLAAGAARFDAGMIGKETLFEVIAGRRLPEAAGTVHIENKGRVATDKAADIALLLDGNSRLTA